MDITPKGFAKESSKLTAEELDAPVGTYVPKTEEVSSESAPIEPVKQEPESLPEPEPVDEPKVPKSRFLTMHQRAIDAERRAAELQALVEAPKPAEIAPQETSLPTEWVAMYGDSDESRAYFNAEQKRLGEIEEKAATKAVERIRREEEEEEKRNTEIVKTFEDGFKDLEQVEGKSFSVDDQQAILDVIEEYSPKDKDGKLIREFIVPISKAHEIWSLKQEAAKASKRESRNKVVSLTGTKNDGEPSLNNDADFIPGRRAQWESKLPT